MLIVDATCLYEVVADAARADSVGARLTAGPDHAAPAVVDVEVVSIIRRDYRLGRLDAPAAAQAVDDLRDWPGGRFGHRPLLGRIWERSWSVCRPAPTGAMQRRRRRGCRRASRDG
jgi:predicted nucleic acid-binding protein